MDRILLAVDSSEHSTRAATLAGELSFRFGAPVDLISVVPEATPIVPGAVHEYAHLENIDLTRLDLLKSVGTEVLAMAAIRVREAGGDVGNQEVIVGPPAHTITTYAEETDADCIVMGRRGLGDLKGLLMGSISHQVGHLSDRTLITVQ